MINEKYKIDILLRSNAFYFVAVFQASVFIAFQALLLLSKFPSDIVGDQMETCRFHDAVNILLSLQVWNHAFYFRFHFSVYAFVSNIILRFLLVVHAVFLRQNKLKGQECT